MSKEEQRQKNYPVQHDPPHPFLLSIHASLAKVAHAAGAAEEPELVGSDDEDEPGFNLHEVHWHNLSFINERVHEKPKIMKFDLGVYPDEFVEHYPGFDGNRTSGFLV